MGRCFCKYYNDDGSPIDTGTVSATLHEALTRNEPDKVILDLLDSDSEGIAKKRGSCMKYAYYVEIDEGTCQLNFEGGIPCEGNINGWKPSDGYDGKDCLANDDGVRQQVWYTYPLQLALLKGRSFAIVDSLLRKHKEAIYFEQQTYSNDDDETYYWLPLHYAASPGASPEVTELLIRMFPEALDIEDPHCEDGCTPKDLARMAGGSLNPESLQLLMKPTYIWLDELEEETEDAPEMPSAAALPVVLSVLSLAIIAVFGAWFVRQKQNGTSQKVPVNVIVSDDEIS